MSLKYVGGGFIAGVPARNLSEEEVRRYGRDKLLASGLYVESGKPSSSEDKSRRTPRENK